MCRRNKDVGLPEQQLRRSGDLSGVEPPLSMEESEIVIDPTVDTLLRPLLVLDGLLLLHIAARGDFTVAWGHAPLPVGKRAGRWAQLIDVPPQWFLASPCGGDLGGGLRRHICRRVETALGRGEAD